MSLERFQENLKNVHSKILFFIVCMCFFIIQGCSTSYQKEGFQGGFSETQIDENVFIVTFEGNSYTGRGKATDLSLLRSAEITLLKGNSYFIIVDSNKYLDVTTHIIPNAKNTTGTKNQLPNNGSSITHGSNILFIQKPSTTNTIVMYKEKPSIQGLIYNADFICNSVGNKYNVVCESKKIIDKLSKQNKS